MQEIFHGNSTGSSALSTSPSRRVCCAQGESWGWGHGSLCAGRPDLHLTPNFRRLLHELIGKGTRCAGMCAQFCRVQEEIWFFLRAFLSNLPRIKPKIAEWLLSFASAPRGWIEEELLQGGIATVGAAGMLLLWGKPKRV